MTKEFLDSLEQPDRHWKSTGAVYRPDDPRDYHLEFLPQVAQALATGLPSSFMVVQVGQMPFTYDQNGEGACCPNSICGAKTIEDYFDVKSWNHYDAHEMYRELGGTGNNGISADSALQYARNLGCKNIADSSRFRIGSYMFAPRNRSEWRNTLAAALVSSGPCVVAMLLPATFGWESGGAPTSGYHQVCLIGYEGLGDDDYAVFLNSWSASWGNKGFCRVKWGFLEDGGSFQNGYVYGYKMVDVIDYVAPDPEPIPKPIPPDPSKQPILQKVGYKQGKGKLILVGENFAEGALVTVDGNQITTVWHDSGWMTGKRLSLAPGIHIASIRNLARGASSTKEFTV